MSNDHIFELKLQPQTRSDQKRWTFKTGDISNSIFTLVYSSSIIDGMGNYCGSLTSEQNHKYVKRYEPVINLHFGAMHSWRLFQLDSLITSLCLLRDQLAEKREELNR